MTTVVATTTGRAIVSNVVLSNGNILPSQSSYNGKALKDVPFPIIFAGDTGINGIEDASFCEEGTLKASLVWSKILMYNFDKAIHLIDYKETIQASIVALVLANTKVLGEEVTIREGHMPFPLIVMDNQVQEEMMKYIKQSSLSPMATITSAISVYDVVAPIIVGFSAQGPINMPSRQGMQWLKPNIAAPDVDILVAGVRDKKYHFMSGTFVACPHISGITALIRLVHPEWSPTAIKSTMMTTATTLNNKKHTITIQQSAAIRGPWDFGVGFVQLEMAMNPGLVYDMALRDYLMVLCGLGYECQTIRKFDFDLTSNFKCPLDPLPRIEDNNLPSFVVSFPNIASLSSSPKTFI